MTDGLEYRSFIVIDRGVAQGIPGFIDAYIGDGDKQRSVAALLHPERVVFIN